MPVIPPAKDQELRGWARNFDDRVAQDPQAYGISAADSAQLHLLYEAYAAALALALDPSTRTSPAIAGKKDARKALLAQIRRMMRIINAQPDLSDAQRADLDLNPRDALHAPAAVPSGKPVVMVDPRGRVRLRDHALIGRAKPRGVFGAVLFMHIAPVGSPEPRMPDDLRFAGIATRDKFALKLPAGSDGLRLWVLAQWINTRGQPGPLSPIASTTIAA